MSDTPETDAAYKYWPSENAELVDAALARKLERERDEAIRQREETNTSSKYSCDYNYEQKLKAERERDEALELVSELKRKISDYCDEQLRLVFENRRLHQERDEALEHLREIKEYGTEEINAAVELRQKLAAALVERDLAREALENHMASTVHSCNDECKRPMCVLRRQRDDAREMVKAICKNKFGTNCEFIDDDE